MAYELDTFNRTTPAGPGGGTHGNPSYELGADWSSWNASATSNGCVIFDGKMTQFENYSFHTVAINTNATTGDDQAVRFQLTNFDTQIWVLFRVHDDVLTNGPSGNMDVDAQTGNGAISVRVQMEQGTPGQVTTIINGSYQGPVDISGSTRFNDSTPHICEVRCVGNTITVLMDGASVSTRSDMGTLPSGSTRRHVGIQFAGDNAVRYLENWESGDYPLSTGPTEDTTPSLFAAGALFAAASGTSITPVIPANDAADDILIMQAFCSASSTFSTPTNWTEILNSGGGSTAVDSANHSSAWFWKRASGSDGNPTSTTSATGSGTIGLYGRIWVYRRCLSSGTPYEDATVAGTPTQSTTPQSAAIDTTGDYRLVVCYVSVDDDNTLGTNYPPDLWLPHSTTFVQPRLASTTGGDGMSDAIQRWMPASGSVAAVTVGTMASDYWRTLTLALLPDAASGDATVTPAVIARSFTIPAATAGTSHTASPAAIARSVTIPAVTAGVSATASPGAIARAVTIPAPTVTATSTASPAAIAQAVTIPAVTAGAGATVTPDPIARSVIIPAVTPTAGGDRTPDTIALVATLPAVTATGTGDATASPDQIARSFTIPAVTASGTGDATASPTVIVTATVMPAPTPSATATASPGVIARAVTIPQAAATGTGDAVASPAAIVRTFTIPAPTATATSTASPGTITVTSTIPGVTASASDTVTPGAVAVTLTIPAVTATGATNATSSPATIVLTVLIPAVTASGNVVLEVSLERTWRVLPEDRTYTVTAERRTHLVRAEDRTYIVEAP